jgi:TetR/AcrR family transcriptional regulator, cholesterol catabolism regulator
MITSTQAVRAQSGPTGYHAMRDLILAVAGDDDPTAEQIRIARLVEQVTFGVLTWAVGGELDAGQAVEDIRVACHRWCATPSSGWEEIAAARTTGARRHRSA